MRPFKDLTCYVSIFQAIIIYGGIHYRESAPLCTGAFAIDPKQSSAIQGSGLPGRASVFQSEIRGLLKLCAQLLRETPGLETSGHPNRSNIFGSFCNIKQGTRGDSGHLDNLRDNGLQL